MSLERHALAYTAANTLALTQLMRFNGVCLY